MSVRLAVLALVATPWIAQSQQPAEPAAVPSGTVVGSVRSAATGETVVGARVSIEGMGLVAFTDAQGRYRLSDVPAGLRIVAARALRFAPGRERVMVPSGDSVDLVFRLVDAAVELSAVVVTATREQAAKSETPASVGVVTAGEIAATRPHHAAEVANRIPGVLVVDLGGEGHTMALRQPINYSPVYEYLEDGIPIRSTGFFNHNALYEINLPGAERIEVLKGPATALYGSDAIGGVVNVLTRTPAAKPTAELALEGGRFGYGRVLGSASDTWGAHGLRLDVNVTHFAGWRDGAHQDRQGATLRWDTRLNETARLKTVVAFANIDSPGDGGSDIPRSDFESHPQANYSPIAFRKVRALRWSTGYQAGSERSLVDVTAYARYNKLGILPNWQLSYDPQVWDTHNASVGLLAKYRRNFAPWRTVAIVGADIDYSPGKRIEDSISVDTTGNVYTAYTIGARQYDYRVTFRGVSPYVQVEASPARRLRLNAGLRFDRVGYDYRNSLGVLQGAGLNHQRPASTSVWYSHLSPKLGLTYEFSDAFNAFVSYRHGFRVPSEDQLFVQGSAENTVDLKPVRANSYEVGLRAHPVARLALETSVYRMDVSDDILTFFDIPSGTSATSNAGRTRHWGVEVGAGLGLSDRLRLEAAYTYARHRYLEWMTQTGLDFSGHDMESGPKHIASTRLTYTIPRAATATAEWVHVGRYFTDPDNRNSYSGYDLLNLYLTTPVGGGLDLLGRLNNVADARYATTASFNPFVAPAERDRFGPGQPRTLFLGLQYTWQR